MGQSTSSTTTYYLNGDSALMAEANDEGKLTRAYGFNPNTQAEELDLWSTDPVWQAELNGKTNLSEASYHYIATDHLGTPMLATNQQGAKTWRSYQEAFGQTYTENSGLELNLRFPGQYYDQETNLHQNYFRDYSPQRGRYIQGDPIGLWGGVNLYDYVESGPLSIYDSTGEFAVVGGLLMGGGNFLYQMYKYNGRIECVNFWESASWAITGSGAGILGKYAANGLFKNFLWNRRFRDFSGPYWKMKGGAFDQWYGVGNLDHWAISSARIKRGGSVLEGLGNAGWNLLEIPGRINQIMGMRGWAPRWLQIATRAIVTTSVPVAGAAGVYTGYTIASRGMAENPDCSCK
ncbi:RHS repeat domain-containing protein [Ottowia testudinis]|uniref:RHS domain-containing protein n=1 Tax=Ottowia testudinis TaxID=2816950 RepID=A0A975H3Z5_9BURK|nr:RHS repeat-associated core domain-containing protein [Ottowia testudinis]QTD46383.1 RHS domain-containing protein [Ottowia testudinis]